MKNKQQVVFMLIGLLLVAYTTYRAATLSITHDEALTVELFVLKGNVVEQELSGGSAANNHWLNTWLMIQEYRLFGANTFTWRLHSVMAHILFLVYSMLIARIFTNRLIGTFMFLALALNPFILDFFSLARGYGLAISFCVASLYYLIQLFNSDNSKWILGYAMAITLMLFSNFSFLNYAFISGVVAAVVIIRRRRRMGTNKLLAAGVGLGVVIAAGIVVANTLLKFQEVDALYFGCKQISDSFLSLISAWLYTVDYHHPWVYVGAAGTALALLLMLVYLGHDIKKNCAHAVGIRGILAIIVLCLIAINLVQHWAGGTPLYQNRTGLFMYPIVVLFTTYSLQCVAKIKAKIALGVAGLLIVGVVGNFAHAANLTHVVLWQYDAEANTLYSILKDKSGNQNCKSVVNISSEYLHHPSFRYYKMLSESKNVCIVENESDQQQLAEYTLQSISQVELYMDNYLPVDTMPVSEMVLLESRKVLMCEVIKRITLPNSDMTFNGEAEMEFVGTLSTELDMKDRNAWVISFTGDIFSHNEFMGAGLVISYETNSGMYWNKVELNGLISYNKWFTVNQSWIIPDELPGYGTLKVYVWNRQQNRFDYRNFEVLVSTVY